MKMLPLRDVQPGMILARSIEDALGRVLINAGEPLTPELIRVLIRRGFAEVAVKAQDTAELERRAPAGSGDHAAAQAELMQHFKARFEGAAELGAAHRSLMRVALRVELARLAERFGTRA